jgi:hypothetical protein
MVLEQRKMWSLAPTGPKTKNNCAGEYQQQPTVLLYNNINTSVYLIKMLLIIVKWTFFYCAREVQIFSPGRCIMLVNSCRTMASRYTRSWNDHKFCRMSPDRTWDQEQLCCRGPAANWCSDLHLFVFKLKRGYSHSDYLLFQIVTVEKFR